jgi:hypothetical protein
LTFQSFFQKFLIAFPSESATLPVPFGLGVQKYSFFLTIQILARILFTLFTTRLFFLSLMLENQSTTITMPIGAGLGYSSYYAGDRWATHVNNVFTTLFALDRLLINNAIKILAHKERGSNSGLLPTAFRLIGRVTLERLALWVCLAKRWPTHFCSIH